MTHPGHPALTAEALAAIYAHARDEYPRECCGMVFGARGADTADEARRCANMQDALHAEDPVLSPRDARTAYHLGARDLLLLDKSLRGDRPARIIYHSHVDVGPDGAYFSDTDQKVARSGDEPTYPVEYLVVDVRADGTRGAAQFAWDEAFLRYVEVRRY